METDISSHWRIPLARTQGSRLLGSIAALLVALLALVMLLLAISLGAPTGTALTGTVALGLAWLAWSILRSVFHRGAWIDVGFAEITIHHPVVFSRPLVIPRPQVRAAAVNVDEDDAWWLDHQFDLIREERGFTMHAGRDEVQALLHEMTRFTVPLVDDNDQAMPNILMVLDAPFRLEHVRRGVRTGRSVSWVKRPERGQEARALLLRTSEPEHARDVFEAWGLRDRVGSEDADILVPAPKDVKRLRRTYWLSVAVRVYVALAVAAWIYETFFE